MHDQKLTKNDFIALRSLEQSRWLQATGFLWKFNKTWRTVSPDYQPAWDAAERLEAMGLAESVICDCGCKRNVTHLTARGRVMVAKLKAKPVAADVHRAAQPAPVPGWFTALYRPVAAIKQRLGLS